MFDMGIIKIEINLAEATKTIQKFKNNMMLSAVCLALVRISLNGWAKISKRYSIA